MYVAQTPPGSAVPLMPKVAQRWRELADQNLVQSTLRQTLMREPIQEHRNRIKGFATSPMKELQQQALQMNWVDSQGAWNFMRWGPESHKEVLVPQTEGRSVESLLQDLETIESLISGTSTRHFGSVKPFRQSYTTSWAQAFSPELYDELGTVYSGDRTP